MSKVNWKGVLLGGLIAGVVVNIMEAIGGLLTAEQFEAALGAIGKEFPSAPSMMAYYVGLSFVMGITLVYVYALIRPRFGPGPKTAVYAGLVVWFVAGILNFLGWAPIGILPLGVYSSWMVLWLIELPLAALAGARFYKEEIHIETPAL
jgi:hypothetical protein